MSKKRKRTALKGTAHASAVESTDTNIVADNAIESDEIMSAENTENSESHVTAGSMLTSENPPVEINDAVTEDGNNNVEGRSTMLTDNAAVVDEKEPAETAELKTSKKNNSKPAEDKRVKLADSSYHYFRHFIKDLLKTNEVKSARFKKNDEGWHGQISVLASEKESANMALTQYKSDNPEIKDLWW